MLPLLAFLAVAPGVEYAKVKWIDAAQVGDGVLHIVRIDPGTAKLVAKASTKEKSEPMTAAGWCKSSRMVVAMNAGMYETDFRTHTGYFKLGEHENSSKWSTSYKSVLAFGGKQHLTMIDREQDFDPAGFEVVIQNLRLIKGARKNVWAENNKAWSEAALAVDKDGKLLLLFSRSPLSMHAFNDKLLALPLSIVRAMHVEGGPEASLSVHGGGVELDLSGSYETGFNENDDNQKQWALPNVIGVSAE